MNRIDGLGPLTTSRTTQGSALSAPDGGSGNGAKSVDGTIPGLDQVSLSTRGRTVRDAAKLVADAPDIRADRVAQLKAAIADGTYTSNARDIAARLMATGLAD